MAEYTVATAAHKILTGTTVDTVTIPAAAITVLNRIGADPLWVTVDGTTPTVRGDNMHVIPAGTWKKIVLASGNTNINATVKVLGNGNEYSVEESW